MFNRTKKQSDKIGLPPGTLMHIGEKQDREVQISVIDYDEKNYQEKKITRLEECLPLKETPTVTWINVDGIHDPDIIKTLGECFDIHPLVLEDIMNTGQRPKFEDFTTSNYVVLKMLYLDDGGIVAEQVSVILGPHFLITFQENEIDVFDLIRDRLRNSKGRIRKLGCDYLMYALIDAIVDNYFIILEAFAERIELLEEQVILDSSKEALQEIHRIKSEMVFLRKSIWPLREVTSQLERGDSELINEKTDIYFRDVYDHTIQIIDTVETYRETVSGLLDIYLSNLSNRMNDVMKTLTIYASIFIPLTFIAGIYGMNFEYMPELGFRWGYPILLVVMVSVGLGMASYFKRKGWF
ncbi:magnesium/cobalt transporter CorA [Candidatus Latescibacterota bacterium]